MDRLWWTTNLRAVWARAYVRVVGINREPSWIFFDTVLPVLGVAAYVFIYKTMNAPAAFTGFVVLGGAMTGVWLFVLWSMAAQFYWEKETGNLELYMLAPISRMSILLGMAVGGMFSTAVRSITTLLIGAIVFQVVFDVSQPLLLAGVFALTMIALFGFGMLFASLFMVFGREAWHTSNLLQEPIYLISGFYFPVRTLGMIVSVGAAFIPITLGLDAMRQLLFPGGWTFPVFSVNVELAVLAVLCVVFIVLSKFALDFMENKGKKDGRLTLRWQ